MDATVNTNIAKKYNVNSYPTVKLLKKESVLDYDGESIFKIKKEIIKIL